MKDKERAQRDVRVALSAIKVDPIKLAVDAIFVDIGDRTGLKSLFHSVDKETLYDIRKHWILIIEEAIKVANKEK